MYSVTVKARGLETPGITFFSVASILGVGVGRGLALWVAGPVVVLVKYFSVSNEGLSFLYASPILGE